MFLFGGPNIRKLAEDRDVDGLSELLAHRSPQVRLEAAEALAGMNEGRGWRYLLDAVRDPGDALVQAAAADILGGLGHPRAVPALQEAAMSARGEAVAAIEEALEALEGRPALPGSRRPETQPDSSIIESLVSKVAGSGMAVLGDFVEPGHPSALDSGTIELRPAETHLQIAGDLREGELQERGLVEARLAAWLRPDWAEVYNMRGVLMEDLEREREALLAYQAAIALDPYYNDALEARDELQDSLGEPQALPGALGSLGWRDRRDALAMLEPRHKVDPGAVIDLLNDDEREVRHAAIEAIGRLHLQSAAPLLLAQQETSWLLRFAILDTLSTLGALEPLVERLRLEMNQLQHRNPVITGSKDPLVELEYDQLFEIGLLALERTGDIAGLLDQIEGYAWEEEEVQSDWEAGEALEELDEDEAEADDDLLSYVDETGLMISQAFERLVGRSLTSLDETLVRRLAQIPDLTLLDPSSEAAEPVVVHDFSALRASAAEELEKRNR